MPDTWKVQEVEGTETELEAQKIDFYCHLKKNDLKIDLDLF